MFINIKKISRLSESMNYSLSEAVVLNPEGGLTDTIADTSAAVSELSADVSQSDAKATKDAMELIADNPEMITQDPEQVEAIEEGVLASFWSKIVKFFQSIINFFNGIIKKIKNFFALQTQDRKDFVKEFKKQREDKKALKAPDDLKWDGYDWSIPSGKSMGELFDDIYQVANKVYEDAVAKINAKQVETGKEAVEDFKALVPDYNEVKTNAENSAKWAITIRDAEVIQKSLSDVSVESMLSWVENSADINKKIKEEYEKKVKVFTKAKNDAETAANKTTDKDPASLKAKWIALKDCADAQSKLLGWASTTSRQVNDKITAEYMKALRKYIAGYKR